MLSLPPHPYAVLKSVIATLPTIARTHKGALAIGTIGILVIGTIINTGLDQYQADRDAYEQARVFDEAITHRLIRQASLRATIRAQGPYLTNQAAHQAITTWLSDHGPRLDTPIDEVAHTQTNPVVTLHFSAPSMAALYDWLARQPPTLRITSFLWTRTEQDQPTFSCTLVLEWTVPPSL